MAKWAVKAATAGPPMLRGSGSVEKIEDEAGASTERVEAVHLGQIRRLEANEEFNRRQAEYCRYKADRDIRAAAEEQLWERVASRREREKAMKERRLKEKE